MGGGGRPAAACALGPPGSPQGTPWGRLCGCPLLPGASALGWAKNSRGDGRAGTRWEARGEGPVGAAAGSLGPGPAVNGAGAPTLFPVAGQPRPS